MSVEPTITTIALLWLVAFIAFVFLALCDCLKAIDDYFNELAKRKTDQSGREP